MLIFTDRFINSPLQTIVIYFNISKASLVVAFSGYINDMSFYIKQNQLLKFAHDAKCFYAITILKDINLLQEDITSLFGWSMDSDLNFNLKKFVQLLFKCNFSTTCTMDIYNTHIQSKVFLKTLGLYCQWI